MCKRLARLALSLFFLALASVPPVAAGAQPSSVRVFLYHRVGDARYPSTSVSSAAFWAQMAWLRENELSVVSTAAMEAHLLDNAMLPPKSAVLHFDDGYRTVYAQAYPVLSPAYS